jgi:hypothetical protein
MGRPQAGGVTRDRDIPTAAAPLSLAIAALMAVAAAGGLWWPHLYRESAWAASALRGGDLVTLAVATPMLVVAVLVARRGSARARLVWAAMLGYDVYNFTFTVFGTAFNKLFLVHIAVLAAAIWALILVVPSLSGLADLFGPRTPARIVAAWCGVVAVILGGMWVYAILRQATTGGLPDDPAGPAGLHMVYATDLTVFVPPLGVAAALLWLRRPWGYPLGSVMVVTSAAYLANLIAAAAFQAHARVPGVAAVSPVAIVLVAGFLAASVAMLATLTRRRTYDRGGPGLSPLPR